MTRILALDASTEACSVALQCDGEVVERFEILPRLHARKLLPMVESLLADFELKLSQLDCLAFGRGPGSFTGLRIAAGVVQGLAFGADIPVVPVSTLATIAQGAMRKHDCNGVVAVLDAHMGEVYWASYRRVDGLAVLEGSDNLSPPAQLLPDCIGDDVVGSWFGAGTGWHLQEAFPDRLVERMTSIDADCYPHALDLVRLASEQFKLGQVVEAEQALPVYLRDSTAWQKKA